MNNELAPAASNIHNRYIMLEFQPSCFKSLANSYNETLLSYNTFLLHQKESEVGFTSKGVNERKVLLKRQNTLLDYKQPASSIRGRRVSSRRNREPNSVPQLASNSKPCSVGDSLQQLCQHKSPNRPIPTRKKGSKLKPSAISPREMSPGLKSTTPNSKYIRSKSPRTKRSVSRREFHGDEERVRVFPLSEMKYKVNIARPKSAQEPTKPERSRSTPRKSSSAVLPHTSLMKKPDPKAKLKTCRSTADAENLQAIQTRAAEKDLKVSTQLRERKQVQSNKVIRRVRVKAKSFRKRRSRMPSTLSSRGDNFTGSPKRQTLQERTTEFAKTAQMLKSCLVMAKNNHEAEHSTTGNDATSYSTTSMGKTVSKRSVDNSLEEQGSLESIKAKYRVTFSIPTGHDAGGTQHVKEESKRRKHVFLDNAKTRLIQCSDKRPENTRVLEKERNSGDSLPIPAPSAEVKSHRRLLPSRSKSRSRSARRKAPPMTYQHMGMPPLVRSPSSENTFHCRLLSRPPLKTQKNRKRSRSYKRKLKR